MYAHSFNLLNTLTIYHEKISVVIFFTIWIEKQGYFKNLSKNYYENIQQI